MAQALQKSEAPFEIVIENEKSFMAGLERARRLDEDLTQPLTQIGLMLSKSSRAIFKLKGPGQYPDLTPKYKARKIRRYGSAYPILRATGRLERSITDPKHPDAVLEVVNRDTLYWGTRVPYGRFHQGEGARRRRPFLIWGADSAYFSSLASTRRGRALNILNNFVLRKLGKDIGPTGAADDRDSEAA